MKKSLCLLVFLFITNSAFALELACAGHASDSLKHKFFYVNCTSQKDMLRILDSAIKEMTEQGVDSKEVGVCEGAYEHLQKLTKLPKPEEVSKQFLQPCNVALRHLH